MEQKNMENYGFKELTRIKELISNGGGFEDKEAIKEMNVLCFKLEQLSMGFIGSGSVREKTTSIKSFGEILFSARRHQRYGGPDKVKMFILNDCRSLESIIKASVK